MYEQMNEQFAKSVRQFTDVTAQAGRLALENTEAVFGLQIATIEENMNAAFAFWGDLAEVRDFDGLKAVWPKGVQIARENVERSIGTGQEVFGRTLKTQEAIAKLAKGQFDNAVASAQADIEKVVKAAGRKAAR